MVLGHTPVLTCCRPPPLPPQDQVSQSAGLPPLPGLKLLRHQLLPHYTVLREGAASAAHRPLHVISQVGRGRWCVWGAFPACLG